MFNTFSANNSSIVDLRAENNTSYIIIITIIVMKKFRSLVTVVSIQKYL